MSEIRSHNSEYDSSDKHVADLVKREFNRRRLLSVGLWGAFSAIEATTQYGHDAELRRQRTQVNIEELNDPETRIIHPHTSSLYFPGLNNSWDQCKNSLEAVQPSLRQIGRMARVGYSNKGFDEDEVFSTSLQYCRDNNISTLHLIGESFSGIVAAKLTPRFAAAGIDVPAIFLLSSPTGPEDVVQQLQYKCMVISYELGITMPEFLRLAGQETQDLFKMDGRSPWDVISQAYEQVGPTACSPVLVQSSLSYIEHAHIEMLDGQLGNTRLAYFGNQSDTVVHFNQAVHNWQTKLPSHFNPTPYLTGNAYHASSAENGQLYCQLFDAAEQDMRLLPKAPHNVRYN